MKIYMAEYTEIKNEDEVLPRTVIKANRKDGLVIATKDGALEITEIQMPNSKKMLAKEYFNGHTISIGTTCYMQD